MSWSDRDVAVAPWIGLRGRSSDAAAAANGDGLGLDLDVKPAADAPSSTPSATSVHRGFAARHHDPKRACRILSLLSVRERVGQGNLGCGSNRAGWLSEGLVVTDDGLARAGAWNPRRLQNMTLAVGPGTPAACVLPTVADSNSSSEEEDIDEDEDEDEEDMFRADIEDEEQEPEAVGNDDESGDGGQNGDAEDASGRMQSVRSEEGSEHGSNGSEAGGDAMELPSDAEEGQEYHFDDSGRLVRDDASAREEAEAEIARHLGATITQSPGDRDGCDDDESEEDEDEPPQGSRRSRWVRRQQSILDALNGVGNEGENDDNMDESGDAHDTNIEAGFASGQDINNNSSRGSDDSSHDSAGLTARDRYNIRQVEQYIDHIETLHRRRERRAASQEAGLSSPARGQGVYNDAARMYEREVARSMKHGGCINTVSWLDCGWRISTVSHEDSRPYPYDWYNDEDDGGDGGLVSSSSSYSSNNYSAAPFVTPPRQQRRSRYGNESGMVTPLSPTEYPTQLLTSGDDHIVKFWDVSQSMGSTSPLPGGSATITPFSSPRMPMRACSELVDSWKTHGGGSSSSFIGSHRRYLPGVVHPLVTLSTGHRGNVFHASPVPHSLGKVATCAADGYLRLLDVEVHSHASPAASGQRNRSNSIASSSSNTAESSAVVISPEYQTENGEEPLYRFHNSLMCFSHHFLSANVGLVCSERGLLHFDLRLPARSQKRGSLVPELSGTCKACYPWRLGSNEDGSDGHGIGELESAYVFAGGSGVDVGLYDLRMTGSSSTPGDDQVVQKYRPRALRYKSSSVAVSGIDLSKDKRELLVSYESDHVYTFPIFEGKDPTLDDIEGSEDGEDSKPDKKKPVPELAAYGGHLNRLTFLKMAKYAGPNDEYICTGSDSGHAWIYEKQSGTVVSFVKADNSTCNGIQPHPSLPYFITYGIDSTAKLWRATSPVDMDVDDSDLGRFSYSKRVEYEKSVVVDKWSKARKGKEVDLDDEDLSFFPDETSTDDNDDSDHFLGVFIRSRFSQQTPFIGNDMMNLNAALAKNYFTVARSLGVGGDDDEPVKSGIAAMKRRVSLIKCRHQADKLGLEFDSERPWVFRFKDHLIINEGDGDMVSYGCLADLIPDNPSDYIPFDKLMSSPPRPGGMHFNTTKYESYQLESSMDRSVTPVSRMSPIKLEADASRDYVMDKLDQEASKQPHSMQSNETLIKSSEDQHEHATAQAWDILFQTVSMLKEAGNEALKASLPHLAARRYDKAINYCSIAYLQFPVGTANFLVEHQYIISKNGGYECRWNELLKTLVMVRLNLAMVYLKNEINDAKGAIAQANLSLKELKPFATEKGVVLTGKKLAKKRLDEPHSTYTEAKALEAKAYFRLGSAQLVTNEYDDAVKTFEHCVDSTKEACMAVDASVLRKINEAKRCRREKKESQRKKFKFMFATPSKSKDDSKGDDTGDS